MSDKTASRWLTLAYVVVMQAITIGIATYSFAFFVVPWMGEFHVSRGTLMIAASGLSISIAILSPLCGYLLDRFESKTLVLFGASSFTLGLLAISAAPSYLIIILVFAFALPLGVILSGSLMAMTLVARRFNDRRGLALGIAALGTSLGGLIMPVTVTYLLDGFHWRSVFIALAALVIVFVIVPALAILNGDAAGRRVDAGAGEASNSIGLMMSLPVIKLGIAFLAPVMLFLAVLFNLGALAADLSISQKQAAWIGGAASVAMAISKVIIGGLCDRIDHRALYSGIVTVLAGAIVVVSLAETFTSLMAAVCCMALAVGGMSPVIASIVAARWGSENFGRVMGVIYAMAGLSGIGSLIAGMIRDASGSYSQAFAYLLIVLVPSVYCFYTLPKIVSGATYCDRRTE